MIVVDTSAVFNALVFGRAYPDLKARLLAEWTLHAPYLLDIEMLHAFRKAERAGTLSADRIYEARNDLEEFSLVRYPEFPRAQAMWDLRHNVTAYDAAFVTLAEALGATLITCDAKLAAAPGHAATVELY